MFGARSYVPKDDPMPEIASEIRAGLDNAADAIRGATDALNTFSGVMASLAAAEHSRDYGDQKDMAAVFYAHAKNGFVDVLRKLDAKQAEQFGEMFAAWSKGAKK